MPKWLKLKRVRVSVRAEVSHCVGYGPYEEHAHAMRQRQRGSKWDADRQGERVSDSEIMRSDTTWNVQSESLGKDRAATRHFFLWLKCVVAANGVFFLTRMSTEHEANPNILHGTNRCVVFLQTWHLAKWTGVTLLSYMCILCTNWLRCFSKEWHCNVKRTQNHSMPPPESGHDRNRNQFFISLPL